MLTLYIDKAINFFQMAICLAMLFGDVSNYHQRCFQVWYAREQFWVGFVGYIILYRYVFQTRIWGSWLPTFEHGLHAIFAVATFHSVTDFHASYKSGHIWYVGGEGNWLITIAPYIFPTVLGLSSFFSLFEAV